MTINSLYRLKEIIENEKFFNFLLELNENDFWDIRDNHTFEEKWLNEYSILNDVKLDDEVNELINEIREISFKNVYLKTGNEEIASYLSDDFELIAKSLFLNKDNWIITHLWKSYLQSKIYIK